MIPLQALNFILMATLFYDSPEIDEMLQDSNKFKIQMRLKLWILIEMSVLVCIVLSNIIFMMIRNIRRMSIDFTLNDKFD